MLKSIKEIHNSEFAGNDEYSSNISTSGDAGDGSHSLETSPSTRQYIAVTQSSIIKRKGPIKPESTNVEVGFVVTNTLTDLHYFDGGIVI